MRRSESADAGARPASDRSFGRVGAVDASRGSDLVAPGTTVRCHRHLLLPRLLSTGSAAHSRRSAGSRCDRQGRVAARRFRDTRSWRRPVARASDPRRDVRLLPRGHAIAGQPPLSAGRTVARTRVSSRRPPGVLVWSAAGRSLAALSPYGARKAVCKQPAHGTDPGQRGCLVAPTPSLRKRVRGRAAARPLMCRLASERGGPVSAGT